MNETDVMNALELGLMQDMQIGQVLISQGFITPDVLDAALELQQRIEQDKLQAIEAADILAKIRHGGMNLDELMAEVEQARPEIPNKVSLSTKC